MRCWGRLQKGTSWQFANGPDTSELSALASYSMLMMEDVTSRDFGGLSWQKAWSCCRCSSLRDIIDQLKNLHFEVVRMRCYLHLLRYTVCSCDDRIGGRKSPWHNCNRFASPWTASRLNVSRGVLRRRTSCDESPQPETQHRSSWTERRGGRGSLTFGVKDRTNSTSAGRKMTLSRAPKLQSPCSGLGDCFSTLLGCWPSPLGTFGQTTASVRTGSSQT